MKGYLRVPALALAVLLLAGCTRGNISYAQGPGSPPNPRHPGPTA